MTTMHASAAGTTGEGTVGAPLAQLVRERVARTVVGQDTVAEVGNQRVTTTDLPSSPMAILAKG